MNLEWQKIEEENQDLINRMSQLRDAVLPNPEGLRKALGAINKSRRTRRLVTLISVPAVAITMALALIIGPMDLSKQPLLTQEEIAALDTPNVPSEADTTVASGAAVDAELASFLSQETL